MKQPRGFFYRVFLLESQRECAVRFGRRGRNSWPLRYQRVTPDVCAVIGAIMFVLVVAVALYMTLSGDKEQGNKVTKRAY